MTAIIVKIGRWPILFALVTIALAVLYKYGPSRTEPRWRWITWGSVTAAFVWLSASVLFSWYVASFGSYNKTYGSLGAVIGFMTSGTTADRALPDRPDAGSAARRQIRIAES